MNALAARVGQNHICTVYMYGNHFGREIIKHTVIYIIYMEYIHTWPTLIKSFAGCKDWYRSIRCFHSLLILIRRMEATWAYFKVWWQVLMHGNVLCTLLCHLGLLSACGFAFRVWDLVRLNVSSDNRLYRLHVCCVKLFCTFVVYNYFATLHVCCVKLYCTFVV